MASPWHLTVDGTEVELRITVAAMIGIERDTGRTLFRHIEAVKERDVSLEHLAIITRHLAGPDCPVLALRGPRYDELVGMLPPLKPHQFIPGERAEDIIARAGVVNVMATVMIPIAAALNAQADADGGKLAA